MWRRLTSLLLVIGLAIASAGMAAARVSMAVQSQMVICAGEGETTITLDRQGNPVAPVHLCPDCMACLAVDLPAQPPGPCHPDRLARLGPVAPAGPALAPHSGLAPQARGPPAPV